jgi:chloride channel 2
MRLSDRAFVNEVFHDRPINHTAFFQISEWPQMSLFVYIILKFLTSILPCGSPMSIGVFGPLFTIGAAVGRLYGETLVHLWSPSQSPATYAVVGAAAFASAATQTVSTSVIFFELTGQLSHMLPVMLACITAYFVSGIIAPSIYDILAEWAGLHSVCYDINEYVLNQKTAETSMVQPSILFTRETTYNDALKALNENKNEEYFPIVDDLDNRSLIGCIRRYDLEVGIARFFTVHAPELPGGANLTVRIKKIIQETLLLDTSKVSGAFFL